MTKLEILEETIAYYSEDTTRRAVDGKKQCQYNTEDGRHCAVGRCFTDEYKNKGKSFKYNLAIGGFKDELEDMLLPQYKGHELSFWSMLQRLHDNHDLWDDKGLTEKGVKAVEIARERIKEWNLTE